MKTLIVEDEPTSRLLLSAIAGSRGFEVTACEDAETAWDAYQNDTYPLVILDWLLEGGMDGLELCRKIRELPQGDRSVVLVVTSRNRTEDLQEVLEAGADDYLAKPINIDLLEVRLTIAERQVEQVIARKNAEAALAEARKHEVNIADNIQRSILLGQPPQDMPSVSLSAITIPSKDIDGDFYDFIRHNDWNLDILVVDVMGKGVPAALLGAAIKSQFLRAISHLITSSDAWKLPTLEQIVKTVSKKMAAELIKLESFATFAYARINLERRRLEFVDCGHTRTIHYKRRTGKCDLLQGENMPLGFIENEVYKQISVPIEAGDLFCFYSDGVTETADPDGNLFGEERLEDLVKRNGELEPGKLVDVIREAVIDFAHSEKFGDDFTVVVVAIEDTDVIAGLAHSELDVSSDLQDLATIREFVHRFCQDYMRDKLSEDEIVLIELAVHETASNVMRHAYDNDPDNRIQVEVFAYPNRLMIRFYHTGKTFDPEKVVAPSFDGSRDGGFGMYIISQCMDEIEYSRDDQGCN
ncbi:MAG: SpoIIE family protein phosphatase, partial [Candidatus Electryoneaceae bacterium]|nr:SpoIIE family protein phosphatase [Candidatus Electryoneaceae bacterium]